MTDIYIKALPNLHTQPPFEITLKGKKYGYLDDSTDYHAMERELTRIKKQKQGYPIIVSFGVYNANKKGTVLRYALYVAKRTR
jgi:hypothetical protein